MPHELIHLSHEAHGCPGASNSITGSPAYIFSLRTSPVCTHTHTHTHTLTHTHHRHTHPYCPQTASPNHQLTVDQEHMKVMVQLEWRDGGVEGGDGGRER